MASLFPGGTLTEDHLKNAGNITSGVLQSRQSFGGGFVGNVGGGGGRGRHPAPAVITSGVGGTRSIRYRRRRIRWVSIIGIPLCVVFVIAFLVAHTVPKKSYKKLYSRHKEVHKYCTLQTTTTTSALDQHHQTRMEKKEDEESLLVSNTKCKNACQNFENCCHTGACYQKNMYHCYQDAKCHILNKKNGEVPPSPNDLEVLCDTFHAAYNEEQCYNACNHARCCWDQPLIPSCLSEHYDMCQDYSYCTNLRPAFTFNKNMVHTAPSNLLAACSSDDENNEQCEELCRPAHCCTNSFSDCFRDNFVACLSYLPCNDVVFLKDDEQITIPPAFSKQIQLSPPSSSSSENNNNNIHQICSVQEVIFNDNAQPCEELCQENACCWESGIDNCFGDDPLGCIHYVGCQLLVTPRSSLDLASIVADSATTSSAPRSYRDFKDANEHKHLVPKAGSIGAQFKDKYVNGKYMGLINDDGSEITTMIRGRTFMHAVCDATSLFADRTPCEQECQPSLPCCNPYHTAEELSRGGDDGSLCFIENIDTCYDYARCHALTSGVKPASWQLDDNCSPEAIAKDKGTCEHLCRDVECCWNQNVLPCYDTKFNVCLDYGMCQNLRTDATISVSPKWLDDECAKNTTKCQKECETTQFCCTDPMSDCYKNNLLACISYGSCPSHETSKHMKPLHNALEPLTPDVSTFCSPRYINLNSNDDCRSVCKDVECCFQTGENNCFGNDPLGCLEHRDCSVLHYNKFPNFAKDVKDVCTDEKVNSSNQFDRAKCENVCSHIQKGGNCCDPFHSTGDDACYHDNLGGCFSHARCHIMDKELAEITRVKQINSNWDHIGETIPFPPRDNAGAPDTIATACDASAIEIDRSACEAICEPARCCWDYERQAKRADQKTAVISCIDTKFPYCLDYAMCQNLRTRVYTTVDMANHTSEEDGKPLMVRSMDLDMLCKSKDIQCFQICGSASRCCNDIYSDCYRDNFVSCLAYGECKKYFGINLHVPTLHNHLLPPATFPAHADIAIVCDPDYIQNHGDTQCQQVCYPASCCWEHGSKEDGNCFGSDPLACMQFMQCRVLVANELMRPYSNTVNNPFTDNTGN